jgi:hypothetical protein
VAIDAPDNYSDTMSGLDLALACYRQAKNVKNPAAARATKLESIFPFDMDHRSKLGFHL